MDLAKPNWKKNDNGTIEDQDNDLMWAVKDSRQELGNGLIGMRGLPTSKHAMSKTISVTMIGGCRVKVRCGPF